MNGATDGTSAVSQSKRRRHCNVADGNVAKLLGYLALFLFLCCCAPAIQAQEVSAIHVEAFNSTTSHRQSVCDRQRLLDNGNLQLRDALEGMHLNIHLVDDDRYIKLNDEGEIDRYDPGITIHILDELSKRAGFEWRNSFWAEGIYDLPENKTYNDLLEWSVSTFDMSVSYWGRSISRMNLGASFPTGWYDGQAIIVGLQDEGRASMDLWSFLEPFSTEVWVMIVVTIVFSAMVYLVLDWLDGGASDALDLGNAPLQNIYLAALSFTGHYEFQPKTTRSRLFTVSLAFWSLIMMSAYTANLASFLVVQHTPSVAINSVSDVVRNGYHMCVVGGDSFGDTYLKLAYPELKIVYKKTERELYEGVLDGKCDFLFTSYPSFKEFKGDRTINGNCNFAMIGGAETVIEGGFATKSDSGTLCTSLIRDVVNVHLEEMKADGFVEKAWEDFWQKVSTIDCDSDAETKDDDESQLSLQAMGGTFIIHFMVTGVVLVFSLVWRCFDDHKYDCRQDEMSAVTAGNMGDSKGSDLGLKDMSDLRSTAEFQCEEAFEKQNEKLEVIAQFQCEDVSNQLEKLEVIAKKHAEMLDLINSLKCE